LQDELCIIIVTTTTTTTTAAAGLSIPETSYKGKGKVVPVI
jgi:hypothetical protein